MADTKRESHLLPLYLQRVPASDPRAPSYRGRRAFDIIMMKAKGGAVVGRYEWFRSSKPRPGCKTVMLNCWRWRAVWLPDVIESAHTNS